MPILAREPDIFPADLFALAEQESDKSWWVLYTLSRREKDLARRLTASETPFYAPMIPKRTKSPAGRVRTSYVPLFNNYIFVFGDEEDRYTAVSTGCVSRALQATDSSQLLRDLRQFQRLIAGAVALTPESRLQPGRRVRVRAGNFRGLEGTILRREGEERLLVAVNFIQRGASLLLEDFEVEAID